MRILNSPPTILFSLLLLCSGGAPAGVAPAPALLSYVGTLSDPQGAPVVDDTYELRFALYTKASGGEPLWSEPWDATTTPVHTNGGAFSVLLGSYTAIPEAVFQAQPVTYLGVTVGADAELLPRQRFLIAAYAMRSGDGVPSGVILLWSGAVAAVPPGWALCDGVKRTRADGFVVTPPDLRDRFVVGAGPAYAVNAVGGVASQNLSHTHSITPESLITSRVDDHQHSVDLGTDGSLGESGRVALDDKGGVVVGGHSHNVSGATGWQGGHDHRVGVYSHGGVTGRAGASALDNVSAHSHGGATGSAGASALDNRPPYFALAYIMKL